MHSRKPLGPFSAVANNALRQPDAPLIVAARLLAERCVYGLVWLDSELNVAALYGDLVGFVAIGEPITDSIPALYGLEETIRDLAHRTGELFELPAVSIVTAKGASPRMNFTVAWSMEDQCYILAATRDVALGTMDVELSQQTRARHIAEAEAAAKSRELARLNAELARMNADLEAYASIISHDLKSPMRALRYMAEDAADALTRHDLPAAMGKLASLQEQSDRMSGMLSALLDYSTIARREDAVEIVDTRALVAAIVKSIPRSATFTIEVAGSWPNLATLRAPLDLVLRNLIENAVNHHDGGAGRVVVSAQEAPGHLIVTISDDGPGIPAAQREAALLPFRTLGRRGPGTGHGMGLALVRRAVEAVGGRLALEDSRLAARGITVVVSWPLSETLK